MPVCVCVAALPHAPHNLSLAHILATAAIVQWEVERSQPAVTRFEMSVLALRDEPVLAATHQPGQQGRELRDSEGGTVTTVATVAGVRRSHALQQLLPDTEYQLYLVAYNAEGMSNASNLVTFRTLPSQYTHTQWHYSHRLIHYLIH